MKIPYCICEKRSKELFSNGFVILGLIIGSLLVLSLLVFILFGPSPIFFLLAAFSCVQWVWAKLEFKRQALFLGHSSRCASRYSTLAAFAAFRGYDPQYGKLTGYKSAVKTKVEQLLGKRKTRQVYRALVTLGGLALTVIVILLTYDGLTRARNGLPETSSTDRYTPVVSEAVWMAAVLPILAFFVYEYLKRRIKNTVVLIAIITAGMLLAWITLVYAFSQYARLNFWVNVRDAVLILAAVSGFLFFITFIEKTGFSKKRKKRRQKHS